MNQDQELDTSNEELTEEGLQTPDSSEVVEEVADYIPQDGVEEETPEAVEEVAEKVAAPDWVKELRKSHREAQRENRELKAQLDAQAPKKASSVGAKPKLEDFDYDAEEFEKALTTWFEQKRGEEAEIAQKVEAEKAQAKEWEDHVKAYTELKGGYDATEFEEAENLVTDTLTPTQQGIIVQGAGNPAKVIYELGKNPAKVFELSRITDPIKFSFAVAKIETGSRMKRKQPPPPERRVAGTAPITGGTEAKLERLRADAEKTGDYTAVVAYRRQLKRKPPD
jgi:hypothetical protein